MADIPFLKRIQNQAVSRKNNSAMLSLASRRCKARKISDGIRTVVFVSFLIVSVSIKLCLALSSMTVTSRTDGAVDPGPDRIQDAKPCGDSNESQLKAPKKRDAPTAGETETPVSFFFSSAFRKRVAYEAFFCLKKSSANCGRSGDWYTPSPEAAFFSISCLTGGRPSKPFFDDDLDSAITVDKVFKASHCSTCIAAKLGTSAVLVSGLVPETGPAWPPKLFFLWIMLLWSKNDPSKSGRKGVGLICPIAAAYNQ